MGEIDVEQSFYRRDWLLVKNTIMAHRAPHRLTTVWETTNSFNYS